MIFAAGRGQRLSPLTDKLPKPLITVGQQSLLEHHIKRLADADFDSIVINVAHLGGLIKKKIGDGSRYGIPVHYSEEGEQALETGGGIAHALPLLGEENFLAISADIYCAIPFDSTFSMHNKMMHLFMIENPPHHPRGDFYAHELNMVDTGKRYTYSGVGYFNPSLFKDKQGKFPLSDIIKLAIMNKCISAELYRGIWHDVGTGSRLHDAHKHVVSLQNY